jgi:hypothetical protein
VSNRYAQASPLLHPAQRRFITKQEYVACELAQPVRGRLASIRVLRVARELIHVAGSSPTRVRATAVTFRLKLTGVLHAEAALVVLTAHAVPIGHRWSWILPPARPLPAPPFR